MATDDKHCQTSTSRNSNRVTPTANDQLNYEYGMYDATIPVLNATEVASPEESEEEGGPPAAAAMSKFNPPVRHTARHDFDSESNSDSDVEKFLSDTTGEDQSPDRTSDQRGSASRAAAMTKQGSQVSRGAAPQGSKDGGGRAVSRQMSMADSSEHTESDSNEDDVSRPPAPPLGVRRRPPALVLPPEGAYDPKAYQDLKVPPDMENIFQYILKYTPQKIDIDFKLSPFVPEYVAAVGDIDAFIKVTTPACNIQGKPLKEEVLEHIDNLGLSCLDEPAPAQSDAALLQLQLRALARCAAPRPTLVTKKIDNAEKNSKAIDRWIKDVSALHLSKPPPNVNYTVKMPDIDSLMEEWPSTMEEALNEVGFPPADLDCTLAEYVQLTCAMFDIPVAGPSVNDSIQALHVLFTLYLAVKNSQLYAERQKDKVDDVA